MRILINRSVRYGGISTFLIEYIKLLNISKRDILVLDSKIDTELLEIVRREFKGRIFFLPKIDIKLPIIMTRIIQSIFLQLLLNKHKETTDIIFIDWNMILDFFSMFNKCKKTVFVHTYPTRKIPDLFKKLIKIGLSNTKIYTVSNYSASQIENNWNIDRKKIKVIYNHSKFIGNSKIKTLNKEKINIVTIAHCEEYKNPKLWLEVARKIIETNKNTYFHWYGSGSQLLDYQQKTRYDKNIYFHGYHSNPSLILDNDTSIYIQTSNKESLGISILDAMNYSIPCIVSNIGGMPELIISDYNGFVCNDYEDFISRINELISDNDIYERFSKNAKKYYESNFSIEKWKINIQDIGL